MAHHPDSKKHKHHHQYRRAQPSWPPDPDVQQYFADIEYPASKDDLIAYAQEHGAPRPAIDLLQAIPDRMYGTRAEVDYELSKGL